MWFSVVQDRIIKSGKRSSASHIYLKMCPCYANNCLMAMPKSKYNPHFEKAPILMGHFESRKRIFSPQKMYHLFFENSKYYILYFHRMGLAHF